MTTQTEAMKLALEDYLSREMPAGTVIGDPKWWAGKIANVLAKQEQGEPVAWMFQHEDTGLTDCVDAQQVEWGFEKNNPRWQKIGPLYTTPQQGTWVGLTVKEIDNITAQKI